jgi:hypothetical protein
MRSFPSLIGLSVLLVGLCWCAGYPVAADEVDVSIDKALKISGMAGQVEHLGQAILAAVPEDAFPDKRIRSDAAAFVKEQVSRDSFLELIRSGVREQVDAETLVHVLNFYESKLGKKVGRAQNSAVEPAAVKKAREGRTILLSLGESRMAALRRIIAAQEVSTSTAQLLSATVLGLAEGSLGNEIANVAQAEDTRRKIRLVESEIRADRNRMEETALISYALTFRTLEDKELEELAAYEESPGAIRFRRAVMGGLERAVFRVGQRLGEFTVRPKDTPKNPVPRSLEEKSHQFHNGQEGASPPTGLKPKRVPTSEFSPSLVPPATGGE